MVPPARPADAGCCSDAGFLLLGCPAAVAGTDAAPPKRAVGLFVL